MTGEQVVGKAFALAPLEPGEPCIVVCDSHGDLYVRQFTEDDALMMSGANRDQG